MIPGPWSRATQCLLPTEHPSSIQPTVMYVSCLIECEEDLNKESLTTMTRLYYSLRHSPLSKPIVWSLVYFSQLIITSHSQSQFFAYLDFRFGALFKFSFSQGPLFRRHILIFTCKFNLQPRRLRLFFSHPETDEDAAIVLQPSPSGTGRLDLRILGRSNLRWRSCDLVRVSSNSLLTRASQINGVMGYYLNLDNLWPTRLLTWFEK